MEWEMIVLKVGVTLFVCGVLALFVEPVFAGRHKKIGNAISLAGAAFGASGVVMFLVGLVLAIWGA